MAGLAFAPVFRGAASSLALRDKLLVVCSYLLCGDSRRLWIHDLFDRQVRGGGPELRIRRPDCVIMAELAAVFLHFALATKAGAPIHNPFANF